MKLISCWQQGNHDQLTVAMGIFACTDPAFIQAVIACSRLFINWRFGGSLFFFLWNLIYKFSFYFHLSSLLCALLPSPSLYQQCRELECAPVREIDCIVVNVLPILVRYMYPPSRGWRTRLSWAMTAVGRKDRNRWDARVAAHTGRNTFLNCSYPSSREAWLPGIE